MDSFSYLFWFILLCKTIQLHKASRQRRSVHHYLSNPARDIRSLSLRFLWDPCSRSSSLFSQLLSLPPSFFPYIHPYPSPLFFLSRPGDSLWHWQKDLSRLARWMLGGMYITDQQFPCLLSPMDSSTTLGPLRVHACISKSDVYEKENLPPFSPPLSSGRKSRKSGIWVLHITSVSKLISM